MSSNYPGGDGPAEGSWGESRRTEHGPDGVGGGRCSPAEGQVLSHGQHEVSLEWRGMPSGLSIIASLVA